MTSEYNEAERSLLEQAPVAVIAGMIGVSPSSPVGIMQEVGAAVKTFEEAAETMRDNPLVASALVALKGRFEGFTRQQKAGNVEEESIIALGSHPERAVELCREVNALLDERAAPEQAAGYRQLLFTLAENVAHGAKEGGLLGIGGEQVNKQEQGLLEQIAAALGLNPPADPGAHLGS